MAESLNGTKCPPSPRIEDADGGIWTRTSTGRVRVNNVNTNFPGSASLIEYWNHDIYGKDTAGQWWYNPQAAGWQQTSDPNLTTSPNDTTIPSATQIVDTALNVWTVSGGVVYKNGATAGFTDQVTLLLWHGGNIYQRNVSNLWWEWVNDNWSAVAGDPRGGSFPLFYGVNNHYDYPPLDPNAAMDSLGATMLRVNTGGGFHTDANDRIWWMAQALQGTNKKLCLVIDSGILGTSESTAYTEAFNSAKALADQFGPMGVTHYEAGNELDRDPSVIVAGDGRPGDRRTDYQQTGWARYRGTLRGLIDGIHASNASYTVGVHFCVAGAAGAGPMLWNGTEPNNATGKPTCRWDVTGIHNYEVFGDPWNMGSDAHGANFDLLTYCTTTFAKPIWVSEFNCGPEAADVDKAAYLNRVLPEYYARRVTNNIISLMYYELLSDPVVENFGLSHDDVNPGADQLLQWQAFANFAVTHPA